MDSKPAVSPVSTENQRKIRSNYFKKEVALKSYKCDFKGPAVDTRAKVYICLNAVHIVHRPKRRKLTTIPFSIIRDIVTSTDKAGINIHINSGPTYSLQHFERPNTAMPFILNYWKMVRMEVTVAKQSRGINISQRGSSESVECDLDTSAQSGPGLSVPTTVSLVSSASLSESESLDSLSLLNSTKPSVGSNSSEAATHEQSSRSLRSSASDVRNRKVAMSPGSHPVESPPSYPPAVTCNQSSKLMPATSRALTIASTPVHSVERKQLIPPTSSIPPHPTSPITRTNSCIAEVADWLIWPLSLLPYPLSCSNQRFTMAISYVLLAFLFCSTIHLYHRLAVFSSHGNRLLRSDPRRHTAPYIFPTEWGDQLATLDTDLSELISLAEQLTHSIAKLTTELQRSHSTFRMPSEAGNPDSAGEPATVAAS